MNAAAPPPFASALSIGSAIAAAVAAALASSPIALYADAPIGRYVVADGSVTDTKTNLTWQQSVPSTSYSRTAALAYCAALPTAGASWRVPSVGELQTLIDESVQSPSIDQTTFPNTPADFFWTSSEGPSRYRGYAYGVSFISGFTTLWNEGTLRRVRCVH